MKKKNISVFNLIVGILLLVYALILAFAVYWIITTSLKDYQEFKNNFFGIPKVFKFGNIKTAMDNFKLNVDRDGFIKEVKLFPDIISYTLLYTVGSALIATFVPCIVSYACAKYDFAFGKILYVIVIFTMIMPIVGNLPAMLNVLYFFNMYDTFIGNWIMKANFLGMYFLIFYAAFQSLPKDYMEAAYIDGASEWRTCFRIMLPLVRPIFLTIVIIYFIDFWNDYQTPLLYLPSHPTIAYGVYKMSTSVVTGLSNPPMKMASCVIMCVPTVALFIIFREKLMGNLSMGGLKG